MTSRGLAQIDENSSLVQTNGNGPLVLPTLLTHSAPQSGLPSGDSTPEAWPKTPTPQSIYSHAGFALGDQTPESWPEFAPSFCVDWQQPDTLQGRPVMISGPAITSVPQLWPMWPCQVAWAQGTVFQGSALDVVNMSACANPQILAHHPPSVDGAVDGLVDATSSSKAPVDSSTSTPGTDGPPCPVAVYVDLSALRERVNSTGLGNSGW